MDYLNFVVIVVVLALIVALWFDMKRDLGEVKELIGRGWGPHEHLDPVAR